MNLPPSGCLYLAGPLFSAAERSFNEYIAQLLSARFEIFLPQRDGELLVERLNLGEKAEEVAKRIFAKDINAIRSCQAFLLILDGRAVDEGGAFELGVAYALGKECYGLQTDPRRLLPSGNNPMIDGALQKIFRDEFELCDWAQINTVLQSRRSR